MRYAFDRSYTGPRFFDVVGMTCPQYRILMNCTVYLVASCWNFPLHMELWFTKIYRRNQKESIFLCTGNGSGIGKKPDETHPRCVSPARYWIVKNLQMVHIKSISTAIITTWSKLTVFGHWTSTSSAEQRVLFDLMGLMTTLCTGARARTRVSTRIMRTVRAVCNCFA